MKWDVIIAETSQLIVREFADTISTFLPYGGATAISGSLNAPGK